MWVHCTESIKDFFSAFGYCNLYKSQKSIYSFIHSFYHYMRGSIFWLSMEIEMKGKMEKLKN